MRIHSVFACDEKWGISRNGELPWDLPKDYHYFNTLTLDTRGYSGRQNAVVMGRKNWYSKTPQDGSHPLPGRHNFVLSKTIGILPEGADGHASSIADLVNLFQSCQWKERVARVFNIGGAMTYSTIQDSDVCGRVYVTKIKGDFNCDTFCPNIEDDQSFRRVERSFEYEVVIPQGIQYENGLEWEVMIYDKIRVNN